MICPRPKFWASLASSTGHRRGPNHVATEMVDTSPSPVAERLPVSRAGAGRSNGLRPRVSSVRPGASSAGRAGQAPRAGRRARQGTQPSRPEYRSADHRTDGDSAQRDHGVHAALPHSATCPGPRHRASMYPRTWPDAERWCRNFTLDSLFCRRTQKNCFE